MAAWPMNCDSRHISGCTRSAFPSWPCWKAASRSVKSLAMKAGEIGRRARDLNSTLFRITLMVTLRGIQGRSDELVDPVRAAVEEYPFIPSWHSTLAKIYAELDRIEEARAEMMKVGDFAEYPRDGAYVVGMALQGQVAARIGDRERARMTYVRLLPFAGHNIILGASGVFYGPVPRYLGQLAEALGDYGIAEQRFEEAITMARRVNSPPFVAYCQLEYGAMLLRRRAGLETRGIPLVEQGLALARSLGNAARRARGRARVKNV